MAEGNKPTFRAIAKLTDSRNERFENIGVAWGKVRDDGTRVINIKLSPFVDGAKLAQAESFLLVPYEGKKQEAGGNKNAAPPTDSGDPGPNDDDDIPF